MTVISDEISCSTLEKLTVFLNSEQNSLVDAENGIPKQQIVSLDNVLVIQGGQANRFTVTLGLKAVVRDSYQKPREVSGVYITSLYKVLTEA